MRVTQEGRRFYITGNTYAIKDDLKAAGCKWDQDRKAWWTGKRDVADRFAKSGSSNGEPKKYAITDDTRVLAKAKYTGKSGKERTYYVVAESRDGQRVRMTVLDGSFDFWVDRNAAVIVRTYEPREVRVGYSGRTETRHQTLGSLRKYIERMREAEKTGNICADCGGPMEDGGHLDHEDGLYKHYRCCDIPA